MTDDVRPIAIGVPRRDDEIFVAELHDPETNERFYRPIGGGIEFGESSPETIVREFREELDVAVEVGEYLGALENVFTFAGARGHEIVLAYEIEMTDALWSASRLEGHDDGGVTYTATWKELAELDRGAAPLYPEGLRVLLRGETTHVLPRG